MSSSRAEGLNCIQFRLQERCVTSVDIYFVGSFSSVCVNGTLAHLIVECTTCMVNIIAVHLCPDADNSINLLFLCTACPNSFGTVKCLMEAYVRASANKVRGKIMLKNFTN